MSTGTQLSDMTLSVSLPAGSYAPFIVTDPLTGLSPASNYRYDLGADLITRVSYTALAASGGAALVGSTAGNVQTDIDARPTSATLAADTGATLVGADDGAGGSIFTNVAGFIAKLLSSAGASIVGFLQSGTGAVARTAQDKMRDVFSVKDFGAVGDDTTDDTVAVQKAIDAAYAQSGGTIFFPRGSYKVSNLSRVFSGTIPIFFKGEGKYESSLTQISGSNPILTYDATGIQDIYGGFEDIGFQGISAGSPGLRLINCARFTLNRVLFRQCSIGLDSIGSLVYDVNDCSFLSCTTGMKARKGSGGPWANLIKITGGEMRGNTTWGLDFGEGSMLTIRRLDLEQNGTSGDVTTGGIVLRSTVDDETGYAVADIQVWGEGNFGNGVLVEPSNLILNISSSKFANTQAGRGIVIGNIYTSSIRDTMMFGSLPATDETLTVAAAISRIEDCFIEVVADTSTYRYHNLITPGGNLNENRSNAAINWSTTQLGFYGTTPINKPTGVAVTAAGIHAALVSLGLIAA